MVQIGPTDLDTFPLVLGGNTFGWTSDEQQSGAVLDAFTDAGGKIGRASCRDRVSLLV